MGAALTQHPELFRAVVSHVGIYDMLRVELHPNGAFNVTEFGTVKEADQFRALYAYSPYHHVVDGTQYPAVLFLTGDNDPRVDPANSRKMTARLQASGHAAAGSAAHERQLGPRHRDGVKRADRRRGGCVCVSVRSVGGEVSGAGRVRPLRGSGAIDRDFLVRTMADLVRINSINPTLVAGGAGEAEIAAYVAESLGRVRAGGAQDRAGAGAAERRRRSRRAGGRDGR